MCVNQQVCDVMGRPQGRRSESVIYDGRRRLQVRNSGEPGEPLTLQFSPLGTAGRSGRVRRAGQPWGLVRCALRKDRASLAPAQRSSGKRPPLGARWGRRVLELIRVSHPPPGFSQMAACGGVTPTPLGGHSARTRRKVENPSLGSHRRGHPTPVFPQIELIY